MLRYPNLVRNLPAKEAVPHGPWAFESLSQRQYVQVVEWNTRQAKDLIPLRIAGSSPSPGAIYRPDLLEIRPILLYLCHFYP